MMTLRFGIEGNWFEWDQGFAAQIHDETVAEWIRSSVEAIRGQMTAKVTNPYAFHRCGDRVVFARLLGGRIEVNVFKSLATLDFLTEED